MPNKKKTRILANDPGTKEMGIAVLDDSTLLYHGVETTKKFPSPHERLRQWRKIVERLLSDFRPTLLTVEKTFFANNRNAALLNVLADEIRSLGRRRGIPVVSLAPNTVKKAVAGNGWASKEQVAIAIAAK
jgi:crossover junction endodeoxyribonuclease RuvC